MKQPFYETAFKGPGRIETRFAALRHEGHAGLVCFVTGGDPDPETSFDILQGLPAAGADVIEIGMPFSDPMADGPAIQAANLRALKAGSSVQTCLDLVARFRKEDTDTPIILMGYFNPLLRYGIPAFLKAAREAGVDGLIVVDLPAEEDEELAVPAAEEGIRLIGFITPTTGEDRIAPALARRSGFVYYIAIAGITGTRSADLTEVQKDIQRLKKHTQLPISVGFGIKNNEQAKDFAQIANGVVVGSAIVEQIATGLENGLSSGEIAENTHRFVTTLAEGVTSGDHRGKGDGT